MAKELNTDLVVFSKPQKEDTYYRSQMSAGQDPVVLQTPPLVLVSRDGTLVEFALGDRSAKSLRFYEQIARLDDLALRTLGNQSEAWFQKKIPMDKLKTMYQPCVAPTPIPTVNHFRFRLARNLRIFRDSPQDEITIDELLAMEPHRVSCILRFEGILIAGSRARLDVRVAQILTIRPKDPIPPKEEPAADGYDSDAGCTFPEPSAEPQAVAPPPVGAPMSPQMEATATAPVPMDAPAPATVPATAPTPRAPVSPQTEATATAPAPVEEPATADRLRAEIAEALGRGDMGLVDILLGELKKNLGKQ